MDVKIWRIELLAPLMAPLVIPLLLFGAILVILVAATGCQLGDDEEGPTRVDVALNEFTVDVHPGSVKAKRSEYAPTWAGLNLVVENKGTEKHEFVLVETSLDPGALPTAEDGSFDEEGEGVRVLDQKEDLIGGAGSVSTRDLRFTLSPGASKTITVTLVPGSYVLLCNLVVEKDGETEAHFAKGMYTGFTVNAPPPLTP